MEKLKISEIAGALGTACPVEGEVLSLCTDSREVTPGCLFVAIQGERFEFEKIDDIPSVIGDVARYS